MNRLRILFLLAWRDAVRNEGRSLLIVALVALPVLVIGAADVLFRSTQSTPEVSVRSELASSSAYLWAPVGATFTLQSPTDTWPGQFAAVDKADRPAAAVVYEDSPGDPPMLDVSATPLRPESDVLRLLPSGSMVTRWDHGSVPVSADGARYNMAEADLLDIASPAAGKRYRLISGTASSDWSRPPYTDPLRPKPLSDKRVRSPGPRPTPAHATW